MIIGYRVKQWLKNVLRKPLRNLRWLLIRVELSAMRMANQLPFVSIEHNRLYPPKNSCASTLDWISQFGRKMQADIQLVDASYIAVNKAPKTIYAHVRRTLSMDQDYVCPQTFVACVPRGRVLADGIIITPDDQLLDDVSVTETGAAAIPEPPVDAPLLTGALGLMMLGYRRRATATRARSTDRD